MNKQTVYEWVSVEDSVFIETNKLTPIMRNNGGFGQWIRYEGKQTDEQFKNVLKDSGITHYLSPRQAVILSDGEVEAYEKMEQEIKRLKRLMKKLHRYQFNSGCSEKLFEDEWQKYKSLNSL